MKRPHKSLEEMNEHDVIRFWGRFPDKIIQPGELDSTDNPDDKWVCACCGSPRIKKGQPCKCGSI